MALVVLAATGCREGVPVSTPTPSLSPPPFQGMGWPRSDVALVVMGEVTDVTWVLESSDPDSEGFCYYNASVGVERTFFGPALDTVTIRRSRNSISSWGSPFIDKSRVLKEGDRIVAFLGRGSGLFSLEEDQFVPREVLWVQGQEVVKYVPVGGGGHTGKCAVYLSQRYERETLPLEEVVAWTEEYSREVLSASN